MKKTYMQPALEAVEIKMNPLMVSSPTPGFNPTEETSDMDAPKLDDIFGF